jgi:hypothetical protein
MSNPTERLAGGGPFLFDERQVEMKCRWALNSLLG